MALGKDALLEAGKPKTEVVIIEGGDVVISQIRADDYMSMWDDPTNKKTGEDGKETIDMSKFTPALLVRCITDETGERIFTDEDASAVAQLSQKIFKILADKALELNGMKGDEVKNSEADL